LARGHDPRIHETPDASDIRNPDTTHEVSDVNTRGILWFVLFLAALIVIALLLLRGMSNVFESWARTAEGEKPVMARTEEERRPPEPRLQAAPGFQAEGQSLELKEPQAEWKVVRRRWQEELETYDWTDRDNKLARIPISEAMKIVAQKGVQPLPATGAGGNQQQPPQATGQTQPSQTQQQQQQQRPSESSSGKQNERRQP
jgi:hypothetical protein